MPEDQSLGTWQETNLSLLRMRFETDSVKSARSDLTARGWPRARMSSQTESNYESLLFGKLTSRPSDRYARQVRDAFDSWFDFLSAYAFALELHYVPFEVPGDIATDCKALWHFEITAEYMRARPYHSMERLFARLTNLQNAYTEREGPRFSDFADICADVLFIFEDTRNDIHLADFTDLLLIGTFSSDTNTGLIELMSAIQELDTRESLQELSHERYSETLGAIRFAKLCTELFEACQCEQKAVTEIAFSNVLNLFSPYFGRMLEEQQKTLGELFDSLVEQNLVADDVASKAFKDLQSFLNYGYAPTT
jgi:hypothetical protein